MSNTQTAAGPQLVIRRTFNAPRERVFDAFTNAELLRQWFTPPGKVAGEVTFDPRVGGRYRVASTDSAGEEWNFAGVISEFRAPERLAYTFHWEEDDKSAEHEMFVTVDFTDLGGQTEIVFTQTNFASEASRDGHIEGWNQVFDKLPPLLERR
jgi:uncharacterized protein YndB with AHSA1/START domain